MVGLSATKTRRKEVRTSVPSRVRPDDYKGPRSPDQAAAWLTARGFEMSASTVRRLVKAGVIRAIPSKSGKGAWVRIKQSELERYIRDHQ